MIDGTHPLYCIAILKLITDRSVNTSFRIDNTT
jgi:hypothetical protein